MKIAVLASGGVDSSVVLALLKEQGHDVTAFYLKIWLEDELSHLGECPWEEDLHYVEQICEQFDIPLKVVPLQKEYWDQVVSYTVAELKAGRTPNPDMMCNLKVKFGKFFEHIDESFEKVASGHYAWVEEKGGIAHLMMAPDPIKDQTYFLAHLDQTQVARAMFPLGKFTKAQVRELAQKFNLPNKDRKDSQGVCFLGKIKFREFARHHLGEMKGDIVEFETGEKLGEHEGFWFYTVGQRRNIRLSGGPWFVVKKDCEENVIYVSKEYHAEDKARDEFEVEHLNWITGASPDFSQMEGVQVKMRHGEKMYEAKVVAEGDRLKVKIPEQDQGIAAGQFAVFYYEGECLGGGRIA